MTNEYKVYVTGNNVETYTRVYANTHKEAQVELDKYLSLLCIDEEITGDVTHSEFVQHVNDEDRVTAIDMLEVWGYTDDENNNEYYEGN